MTNQQLYDELKRRQVIPTSHRIHNLYIPFVISKLLVGAKLADIILPNVPYNIINSYYVIYGVNIKYNHPELNYTRKS